MHVFQTDFQVSERIQGCLVRSFVNFVDVYNLFLKKNNRGVIMQNQDRDSFSRGHPSKPMLFLSSPN